jgi:hypothetical protein
MTNTMADLVKEIEIRMASDQWDLSIARKVLLRRKRRFAILAGTIPLAAACLSFLILSVSLKSSADTELASLLAQQINTSYELAGGGSDTIDDAIDELITVR